MHGALVSERFSVHQLSATENEADGIFE